MYKFITIRNDIIKQCHGNYKEMKKFNYNLEIGIFRHSTQIFWGDLRGSFQGFGCPKRHPDALLAKTMAGDIRIGDYHSLSSIFHNLTFCHGLQTNASGIFIQIGCSRFVMW